MGDKYVQPPTLDYAAIYRQSTNMTPIVFVLSPGADPAFDVFKLGKQCWSWADTLWQGCCPLYTAYVSSLNYTRMTASLQHVRGMLWTCFQTLPVAGHCAAAELCMFLLLKLMPLQLHVIVFVLL